MTEQESEVIGSAGLQLSRSELAQMIDISAVQAFHTEEDVRNLAGLALEQRFIAAHALPHFVAARASPAPFELLLDISWSMLPAWV